MPQACSEFGAYSLDNVDAAFRLNSKWVELRHHQWLALPTGGRGGAERLSICPAPAGRYLGGSVWRIALGRCGQEVVYAVGYNHRKERCVRGRVARAQSDCRLRHRPTPRQALAC